MLGSLLSTLRLKRRSRSESHRRRRVREKAGDKDKHDVPTRGDTDSASVLAYTPVARPVISPPVAKARDVAVGERASQLDQWINFLLEESNHLTPQGTTSLVCSPRQ